MFSPDFIRHEIDAIKKMARSKKAANARARFTGSTSILI
jgi:hypothetical protein